MPRRHRGRVDDAAAHAGHTRRRAAVLSTASRAAGRVAGRRGPRVHAPRAVDGHERRLRGGHRGRRHDCADRDGDIREPLEMLNVNQAVTQTTTPEPERGALPITPLEMRQTTFASGWRGYSREAVRS